MVNTESKLYEPNRISTGLTINENYLLSCYVQHAVKMAGVYGKNVKYYDFLYPLFYCVLGCTSTVFQTNRSFVANDNSETQILKL